MTVLAIFMLLERRELRDRVILLIGYRRMTATTRALDEAGARISRYLLMQSIINGSLGVAVGLGLFVIGVPYAVIWGSPGGRPSVHPVRRGHSVAALLPLALSLAVFPGWLRAGAGRRSVPRAGRSSRAWWWSRGCTVKVPEYRRSRS